MPDSIDAINPQALKAARKRCGLSQEQLADEIRCTKDTVSRWERGAASNIRSRLRKPLCTVLRITWEQLTKPPSELGDPLDEPTVKVSVGEHARASLQLAAERYKVRPRDILELAPLLFVIVAERSLLERRRQLQEISAVMEEAGKRLREYHVDLGGIYTTDSASVYELLLSEEHSLDKKDVFGRSIPYEYWKDVGPFVHFVRDLAKDLPEDAVVSIDSVHGEMIHRYRIADDTLRDCTGISEEEEHGEKLLDYIHSGTIELAECLRVRRGQGEAEYRRWLSDELFRAEEESQRRTKELLDRIEDYRGRGTLVASQGTSE